MKIKLIITTLFVAFFTSVYANNWQAMYKVDKNTSYLQVGEKQFALISTDYMKNLPDVSSKPIDFPKQYVSYIENGLFPQQKKTFKNLQYSENPVSHTPISNKRDILNQCLETYYTNSANQPCYRQIGFNNQENWNIKNPRYLESLLMMDKKILVFLWVAGDWSASKMATTIDVQRDQQGNILPAMGGQALLLVGFDHTTNRFVFKNCWGAELGYNGYLQISYDYIKTYAHYGLFQESFVKEDQLNISQASFRITRWDVGGGNIFYPKAKVEGTVHGKKHEVSSIRLLIKYRNKGYLLLDEQSAAPNQRFRFREKFFRGGARYCILQARNGKSSVTAYIRRKI